MPPVFSGAAAKVMEVSLCNVPARLRALGLCTEKAALSVLLSLPQHISASVLGTGWPCGAGRRRVFCCPGPGSVLGKSSTPSWSSCCCFQRQSTLPYISSGFCAGEFWAPPPTAGGLAGSGPTPVSCPSPAGRGFFLLPFPRSQKSLPVPWRQSTPFATPGPGHVVFPLSGRRLCVALQAFPRQRLRSSCRLPRWGRAFLVSCSALWFSPEQAV